MTTFTNISFAAARISIITFIATTYTAIPATTSILLTTTATTPQYSKMH